MKRILSIAACAVVLGVGLTSSASAHDAGRPTVYCPSTYLCVWWDSHYGGNRYQFQGDNSSWAQWAIDNDDSSSFNNGTSGARAAIYTGTNYTGTRVVCLLRDTWASHHSPNDSGSSNKWISAC